MPTSQVAARARPTVGPQKPGPFVSQASRRDPYPAAAQAREPLAYLQAAWDKARLRHTGWVSWGTDKKYPVGEVRLAR